MDSTLVADLLQTFEATQAACGDLARTVRADAALPLFLPNYGGDAGTEREAAIRSMTQLWHLDPGASVVEAGLLCASAGTVAAAEALNRRKQQFQAAVQAIRAIGKNKDKLRITRLIERVLQEEGRRTEALQEALATARINRLDLLRCYAQLRILPPGLESISWTWAKTHSAIVQVRLDEAIEMAGHLANPATSATALELLYRLPRDEKLAYKKHLPNQLRANLVWLEDDQRLRKAVTISGVVLCQAPTLPRYIWRDNPACSDTPSAARLSRTDVGIESGAYVRALNLHRYLASSAP